MAVLALIFVALRFPKLTHPGLILGWNSDSAIFGMMGDAMYGLRELPVFFWEQSYMGTLTSMAAALAGLIVVPLGLEPVVGPLSLRIGTMLLILGGIVFYWLALRRLFNPFVAGIAALWLVLGPAHLFQAMYAPVGSEQLFFLSGLLFLHVSRGLTRPRDWLIFGLLFGIGWWIHQGIIFVTLAALAVVAWQAGIRVPRLPDNSAVRIINLLLLIWLATGVLHVFFETPAFYLFHAVAEPFKVYVVFRALLALHLLRRVNWRNAALFAGGAFVGYLPVLIGWMLGTFEWKYGLSVPPRELGRWPAQIRLILGEEFWNFIGADARPWSFAVGGGIVLLLLFARARAPLALLTCLAALAFFITSSRAHPGSARYIVPALPALYAFAADGAQRLWGTRARALAPLALLAVTGGLAIERIQQVQAVVDARAENTQRIAEWDPRPTLAEIERRGYRVCYADYWAAYKLEFISHGRIQFILHNSYDRTPEQSRMRAALPVPKCYVDIFTGAVTPYDAAKHEEEKKLGRLARARLARLRGMK